MPSKINPKFISSLIALGLEPEINAVNIGKYLETLFNNVRASAYHWKSWNEVCDELSVEDHIALFKGLLFAECFTGWGRGSVSPVIWTFDRLSERSQYRDINSLHDWAGQYSNNKHHQFFNGKLETFCNNYVRIFFKETLRIWRTFDVLPRRIIPLCTPVYQYPPALVIGTNHSVFTPRVTLENDMIGAQMAAGVPVVNTFIQHHHTFTNGLRAACEDADITLGHDWVGTNRCAVQTGPTGIKGLRDEDRGAFDSCQQKMDILLKNLIYIIAPRNVILAGRYAINLFYSNSTPIEDLECLDIGYGRQKIRIIPINHPSMNYNIQKVSDKLKQCFVEQ